MISNDVDLSWSDVDVLPPNSIDRVWTCLVVDEHIRRFVGWSIGVDCFFSENDLDALARRSRMRRRRNPLLRRTMHKTSCRRSWNCFRFKDPLNSDIHFFYADDGFDPMTGKVIVIHVQTAEFLWTLVYEVFWLSKMIPFRTIGPEWRVTSHRVLPCRWSVTIAASFFEGKFCLPATLWAVESELWFTKCFVIWLIFHIVERWSNRFWACLSRLNNMARHCNFLTLMTSFRKSLDFFWRKLVGDRSGKSTLNGVANHDRLRWKDEQNLE